MVGTVMGIQLKGDKLHFVVFFEEMVAVKNVKKLLGKFLMYHGYPFKIIEAVKDYEEKRGVFTAKRVSLINEDINDLSQCWRNWVNQVNFKDYLYDLKELISEFIKY